MGSTHQHVLFFKNLFIHFFGYAGSLSMCRLFFPVAASRDYSLVVVCWLLIVVASLDFEHRL